jgi:hypothetical protein
VPATLAVESMTALNSCGESALPTLAVDISDNDVRKAVESMADWLEQTGGLYVM